MAATKQVAREAWRIFVNNTRADLYDYMDSVHTSAMARWRSYDGNRDRCDAGPFELNEIDWYRRNRNWGHWLKSVNTWATQALWELHRMVSQLERACIWGALLWRAEKEIAVDETMYLALEETRDLLGAFIHGWRHTVSRMTLTEWCSLGCIEHGWEQWYNALASREQDILRQQAVNNFAPL